MERLRAADWSPLGELTQPAQRFMSKRAGSTVRESPGSHAIYVSRPAPVVALIEQAAKALAPASR